jgi:penicillin amidase
MSARSATKRFCLLLPLLVLSLAACAKLFLEKGFTPVDGEVRGLAVGQETEVLRDASGIPSIFAKNEHDLFFAQGYVHAQDRLWQMELMRRLSTGRVAELAGEKTVDIDHWIRLLGMPALREYLAAHLGEREQTIARAYVEGVNAFIDGHRGNLPVEFQMLGAVPERWTVADVLSVMVLNAWFLETNSRQEFAIIAGRAGLDARGWADLFPSHPGAILPLEPQFEQIRTRKIGKFLPAVDSLLQASPKLLSGGSNNWVVAKSSDGKPLMASDPHLEVMTPGIWYFVNLNAPGYHAAGASMAGSPGIVIGRNEHIVWSFTNVMTDVVDLYVLRLDPADHNRYYVGDQTRAFDRDTQVFKLPKGQQTKTILHSAFGPIITEITKDSDAAVALRWYGTVDPAPINDQTVLGLLELNRATTVQEAFAAGRRFRVLGQNLLVADGEGNIGWHATGAPPLRQGYSGWLPADGSSGKMDWIGYLDYDSMPSKYNPPEGFIATANNCSVTPNSPHAISYAWCAPYRFQRISARLARLKNPTSQDFRDLQMDVHSLEADEIVPKLQAYKFADPAASRMMKILTDWDRNLDANSAGAAVFEVFLTEWTRTLLADRLGDALPYYFHVCGEAYLGQNVLLDRLDSPVWQVGGVPQKDAPQRILETSLARTEEWLKKNLAPNPRSWRWGDLHHYFFAHPGADSPLTHYLLSRGPFPAPGDNNTVNVAAFDPAEDGYTVEVIPSLRMLAPIGDPDRTTIVGPLGQSGQPSHPHYDDMIEPWMRGAAVPLWFTPEAARRNAKARMVLNH